MISANHLYNISLRSRGNRAKNTKIIPRSEDTVRQRLSEGRRWLLEQSGCSQVALLSHDGLRLHAYYQEKQQSHRWAVCVHGYWDAASGMGYWARYYEQRGWNYLLPDLRGHGMSEGGYVGMGWPDRLDILMWIQWILQRDPDAEIILHGVSMGAATVLMTTGEPLPSNVKAAVSDCAFSCAYDQFRHIAESRLKLRVPFSFAMPFLRAAARVRAGYDPKDASAVNQVRRSVTPTLFIHGDDDHFIPPYMLDTLYDAAACPKAKLRVAGADHIGAASTNPELYWRTVESFLTPYLNGGTLS